MAPAVACVNALYKMTVVRNSKDDDLRRRVHTELLHALENPPRFALSGRGTAHARWAEIKAAYRLGVFKTRTSGKKDD